MTYEQIEKIIHDRGFGVYEIKFKTRSSLKGLFIETNDYNELSRKNLWRIVSGSRINDYQKSPDESLARIFNGAEITGLQVSSA
jgi:hypothetical protein